MTSSRLESPGEILSRAVDKRRPFPAELGAFRLLNGPGDGGPPGLAIDRYEDFVVVWAREAIAPDIGPWLDAVRSVLEPKAVVMKVLAKPPSRSTSTCVEGLVPDAPLHIREDEAVFLCDLGVGVQTGLFLDQREARRFVRGSSRGREVLNLFAYTCSFSVQAAIGGAKRVTSVDISRKALRRGRANMESSGLPPDHHRWFDDDVLDHLTRAARSSRIRYDLVILDPPVLGRGRSVFSLDRDLERMLEQALRVLNPEGLLVLSTHARAWSEERLLGAIHASERTISRKADLLCRLGLPGWDHPALAGAVDDEYDRGAYLTTLVLRAG